MAACQVTWSGRRERRFTEGQNVDELLYSTLERDYFARHSASGTTPSGGAGPSGAVVPAPSTPPSQVASAPDRP